MEQMTITAKVQIAATDADKVLLDETMSVYRDACNYVSGYEYTKAVLFSNSKSSLELCISVSTFNTIPDDSYLS